RSIRTIRRLTLSRTMLWHGIVVEVLHKLGRYAEAVTSLDRALALNPNYADAKKRREQAARERDNGKHNNGIYHHTTG
ncbi:MAG: tetratricopeptide repeat protein, partial [Methanoregula sp.]|nr:tetratricopeptide repeat protein [Methanoregula sp.]